MKSQISRFSTLEDLAFQTRWCNCWWSPGQTKTSMQWGASHHSLQRPSLVVLRKLAFWSRPSESWVGQVEAEHRTHLTEGHHTVRGGCHKGGCFFLGGHVGMVPARFWSSMSYSTNALNPTLLRLVLTAICGQGLKQACKVFGPIIIMCEDRSPSVQSDEKESLWPSAAMRSIEQDYAIRRGSTQMSGSLLLATLQIFKMMSIAHPSSVPFCNLPLPQWGASSAC